MTSIVNTEYVQNVLGRWNPSDLAYITELSISQDMTFNYYNVSITGFFQRKDTNITWPSPNEPFYKIQILFSNVKNLSLKEINSYPIQIMGFDIVDISDKHWERINFAVEDYENGRIGFYCESVSITSVVPTII